MDTIAELFSRNILEKPFNDAELDSIIQYMRERRAQYQSGKASKASPPKTFTLEDLGL